MSHSECGWEDRNFAQPDPYVYETGLKLRGQKGSKSPF
jgi:hypothetical protein